MHLDYKLRDVFNKVLGTGLILLLCALILSISGCHRVESNERFMEYAGEVMLKCEKLTGKTVSTIDGDIKAEDLKTLAECREHPKAENLIADIDLIIRFIRGDAGLGELLSNPDPPQTE